MGSAHNFQRHLTADDESITFTPLNVYQLTAPKEFSRNLLRELLLNKSEYQPSDLPQNDATSACSFFSLGIIDKFSSPEYIMS